MLVAGIVILVAGVALIARAEAVGTFFAGLLHGASPVLAGLLLFRKRPKTERETGRYLGDGYRVIGCGWMLLGGLLIAGVFYGTPP
jgi:hypothetical protein